MLQRIISVFIARTKEFYRDKAALGWSLLFPLFMLLGFKGIFSEKAERMFKVGVMQSAVESKFPKEKFVEWVEYSNLDEALVLVNHHKIDFLISEDEKKYWVNESNPKVKIIKKLFNEELTGFESQVSDQKAISYAEWILPVWWP